VLQEAPSLRVMIRYSGKMGRPQLECQILVRGKERGLTGPNLCFESVLGVGFGRWDYPTRDNAERSVRLPGELVQYVARLPERLPTPPGAEPGVPPDPRRHLGSGER
jgi:hypothetical protein